jgi:hypothetical protein
MDFPSSKLGFVCMASALLFLGVWGSTQFVYPQEAQSRSSEIELLPVQGNISMLAGAGGNITVQVGKDGILLVDTGVATMSDKILEAIRTEVGGHRFVIFPHAEPVANTPLLKTFRFQSALKTRLFSKEQAARLAGVEAPRKGGYTFSNVFDGWVLPKNQGHVLVTPAGVVDLPELRNVERTFYLVDTAGTGKVEIELRAHSAATALSELRYPLVKQEKEVPVSKEVKEKKIFYYLFLTPDQLTKLFTDLRTLKLVVDVEYGEGGGRLQVLNR